MILATITVIQCEDCSATKILQHDVEWQIFEDSWSSGVRYQFCPTCRIRPHAEDRIAEEQQMKADIARIVKENSHEHTF